MLTNYEPDWNIDALSDTYIYEAIRYLDPETRSMDEDNNITVLICVGLYILLLGCLATYWTCL